MDSLDDVITNPAPISINQMQQVLKVFKETAKNDAETAHLLEDKLCWKFIQHIVDRDYEQDLKDDVVQLKVPDIPDSSKIEKIINANKNVHVSNEAVVKVAKPAAPTVTPGTSTVVSNVAQAVQRPVKNKGAAAPKVALRSPSSKPAAPAGKPAAPVVENTPPVVAKKPAAPVAPVAPAVPEVKAPANKAPKKPAATAVGTPPVSKTEKSEKPEKSEKSEKPEKIEGNEEHTHVGTSKFLKSNGDDMKNMREVAALLLKLRQIRYTRSYGN